MKTRFKHIFRLGLIATLMALMALPAETEAKRTRSSSPSTSAEQQTTETVAAPAETTAVSKSRRSRRRVTNTETAKTETPKKTVTQRTNESAAKASSTTGSGTVKKQKTKVEQPTLTKFKTEKPNLLAIREATLNPSSPYYFNKLMEKFNKLASGAKMTPDEFRHLYLGYMFQEDYDPYRTSPYAEKVDSILDATEYMRNPDVKLSNRELDTLKYYSEKALKDNPFDLRQMSYMVHILRDRKKDAWSQVWEQKLENLLGAIKSTGTGETKENAWFVIYPMHEYDLIQLLGYEAVDYEYSNGYDYLKVTPTAAQKGKKNVPGFYFNVMVSQDQYDLKHPEGDEEFVGNESQEIGMGADSEEIDYDNLPAE